MLKRKFRKYALPNKRSFYIPFTREVTLVTLETVLEQQEKMKKDKELEKLGKANKNSQIDRKNGSSKSLENVKINNTEIKTKSNFKTNSPQSLKSENISDRDNSFEKPFKPKLD